MKDCCDSWHLGSEIKQIKYSEKLFFWGQKCLNIKIELSTTRKTPSGEPDKTESESCRQFIYKEGISSATNTISQFSIFTTTTTKRTSQS